ncbi:MAG TPA: hypothetical protein EYQ50_19470 [Verrucomicrobiales bacterium]|nr:hypothetical protein [Verrucomicrobiales bacterium]HIL69571.1 hypothetical protein [Verrucomicrobiota bacterium]
MDLSKIEAGKMTVHIEKTRVSDILESLKRLFRNPIEDKGLELTIETSTESPDVIWTDQQRIEQILVNLLSNAVKFTPQGRVSIRVFRPEANTDLSRSGLPAEHSVAFAVTDTGIGIARDRQKEIFEAFQQVDGSTSRQYGGTGLGLSITRELAHVLGGEPCRISGELHALDKTSRLDGKPD